MFEIEKTDRINELIAITKSDSGISGPELAAAHMELGEILAGMLPWMDPADTTVVACSEVGYFSRKAFIFNWDASFSYMIQRGRLLSGRTQRMLYWQIQS